MKIKKSGNANQWQQTTASQVSLRNNRNAYIVRKLSTKTIEF